MKPKTLLVIIGMLFLLSSFSHAQATANNAVPDMGLLLEALRDQALVLKVQVRQIDGSGRILWFSDVSRITVHGRLVGFKLEGETIIMETQFTPFRKDNEITLLVQAQIWIQGARQKTVQYHSHAQSLTSKLGESVLYYPLGRTSSEAADNLVEMEISILPYAVVDDPNPRK